jgi:hypothetical protein
MEFASEWIEYARWVWPDFWGRPKRVRVTGRRSMNKEAQLATMLVISLTFALFGWALVYLASPLDQPNEEQRAIPTRLRRWLDAAYDRLLKDR